MIPEGWKETNLGRVADLIMGQSPPSENCNEVGVGLPFFQGNGEFGDKHPIAKRWIETPLKIVESGDILISVRAPVGEMNIAATQSCIGRGLAAIRAKDAEQGFLYYLIQHSKKNLHKKSQGSTFEAINKDDLYSIQFTIPPLPEQKRIAEVLGGVDAAIEASKTVIAQTKKVKQGLLQTLLTRGIGHTKFKPSPLGEIPEGWEVKELGELLEYIKGGGTPSKKNPEYWNGQIPWASVKDLNSGTFDKTEDFITALGLKESASNLIPAGTIIIATRMAVGKAIKFICDVTINQDLKALFPKPFLNKDFLFFWLDCYHFVADCARVKPSLVVCVARSFNASVSSFNVSFIKANTWLYTSGLPENAAVCARVRPSLVAFVAMYFNACISRPLKLHL